MFFKGKWKCLRRKDINNMWISIKRVPNLSDSNSVLSLTPYKYHNLLNNFYKDDEQTTCYINFLVTNLTRCHFYMQFLRSLIYRSWAISRGIVLPNVAPEKMDIFVSCRHQRMWQNPLYYNNIQSMDTRIKARYNPLSVS